MRLPPRYFLTVVRPFDVLPLVVARPALDFWLWLLSVVVEVVVVVVVVVCLCFCVDDEEDDDDIESNSAHELTLRHTTSATAAAPNVLNILLFMLFV